LTDLTIQFIDLGRCLLASFLALIENFDSPLKKVLLLCTDHGRVYAVTTYQFCCGGLLPKGSQGDLGLEFRAVLFAYFLAHCLSFFLRDSELTPLSNFWGPPLVSHQKPLSRQAELQEAMLKLYQIFPSTVVAQTLLTGSTNILLWIIYIVILSLYAYAFGSYGASYFPPASQLFSKHILITGIVVGITG